MIEESSVIFKFDELKETARKLAKSQRVTEDTKPLRLVKKDLNEAKKILTEAYKVFAGAVKKSEDISAAAEWLIDNFYIIQEQFVQIENDFPVKYQKSLPRLKDGPYQGLPRVYELVFNIITNNDNVINLSFLREYIQCYQEVESLRIGEIWAIPIVVRLILIEQLAEKAAVVLKRKKLRPEIRDFINEIHEAEDPEPGEVVGKLISWFKDKSKSSREQLYLVELLSQLQTSGLLKSDEKRWFEYKFRKYGLTVEEALRFEAQTKSRQQISVQNAVQSLRKISDYDWTEFVENCSMVDRMLRLDPLGVYPDMDFQTRDVYRKTIERISRNTGKSEIAVTEEVLIKADNAYDGTVTDLS
ncbi:MAG: glycosyltransferase 36, partial [Balneolaceae bacterium]